MTARELSPERRLVAELEPSLEPGLLTEIVDCVFRHWAAKCEECREANEGKDAIESD